MLAYTGFRGKSLSLTVILAVSLVAGLTFPGQAQAASLDAASLWTDFSHYTLIARPKLAGHSAQALLKKVNASELLDIVEASDYADNYEDILVRAAKYTDLHDVAIKLKKEIMDAQIARARDPKRISKNIALLDQGRRAYINAVSRLKGAGQFAAPQLLAALMDPGQASVHPYILNAMIAIGRPMVRPLSAALVHLNGATLEQVAQVLAEIGYPAALPALSQMAHNKKLSGNSRQVVQKAYSQLLGHSDKQLRNMDTAHLYVRAGQEAYSMETNGQTIEGFSPSDNKGVVWLYNSTLGLVPVAVPKDIYGDVLAMRAAKKALSLSPDINAALSLWLMANLRRENHLRPGQKDPTYGQDMHPAEFYAMLAGPMRLNDVLVEALRDRDSQLALDAIDALQKTAGVNALSGNKDSRRPLIVSMSYPDKKVRFNAAVALASANPQKKFIGYKLVVPTLASAIRSTGAKYAIVLASSLQRRNDLAAWLNKMGYETLTSSSLAGISKAISQRPGIDLIVTDLPVNQVDNMYRHAQGNVKLVAVPVLALTLADNQSHFKIEFGSSSPIYAVSVTDQKSFEKAVQSVLKEYSPASLSDQQRTQFAIKALSLLRQIAFSHAVYNVTLAEPVLIEAVTDQRAQVAKAAAGVLALINNPQAQQALAKRALGAEGSMQLFMLAKLSESATHWGNLLTNKQVKQISKLVDSAKGKLAMAAAQAQGALALPTSSAVKLILK